MTLLLTKLRNCLTPAYQQQGFESQFGYRVFQKACKLYKFNPTDTLELKAVAKEIQTPMKNHNLTRYTKSWVSKVTKDAIAQLAYAERSLMEKFKKELDGLKIASLKSGEEYAEQKQRVLSALYAASEKVSPSTRKALEEECKITSLGSDMQRTLLLLSETTDALQQQKLRERFRELSDKAAQSLNN
jgi:hypothetical protein